MASKLRCPKCGGHSWIEKELDGMVQRCVCGLRKYLVFSSDGMQIIRSPVKETTVTLPSPGSQLSEVLVVVTSRDGISSKDVAEILGITMDKASTNLSILRSRGLIYSITDRRGKSGGSTWSAYDVVKRKYEEV